MKRLYVLVILLTCFAIQAAAQPKKPEDYGYRHLQLRYQGDPVDLLVLSRKGEEYKAKPIILFDQGSQARPLILLKEDGNPFMLFPFQADILLTGYHLVIVSKPYVPLIAYHRDLKNGAYADPGTGIPPAQFYARDNVAYYVGRAKEVIKHLKQQQWVRKDRLVVAGHSAGSTVAARLALKCRDVTHLIYSGGNPFGRMASMIAQARVYDDSTGTRSEEAFRYWESIVRDPSNVDSQGGDSFRTTYTFSQPPIDYLMKLRIPVLVTYGTKDHGVAFNDYLRLETIRKGKKNFTFKPYIGREHNYFGFDQEGKIDYDRFGWDEVAQDWLDWLSKKQVADRSKVN